MIYIIILSLEIKKKKKKKKKKKDQELYKIFYKNIIKGVSKRNVEIKMY